MHNFAFFGTPAPARETLDALLRAGMRPALVITNPDAPQGRGLALASSPVKDLAHAEGIPTLTPRALDDAAIAEIRTYGAEYAVVVAYGKIFPASLIGAFPLGALNVHYSLLPKYRGATPLEAALLSGDATTGVTIQKMAKELDAGDILAQEETPIAPEETARELRGRLIELGAELLVATLPRFARGELEPIPQDASKASRACKLKKGDGLLDLAGDARENWNKYRAYADTIGTYFIQSGTRYKITRARYGDGRFIVERVIPEGRREVDWRV